jgi:hypothetical protein
LAEQAARAGRHEQALREYVWLHHHGLEHDPGFYGVRLSFALGRWIELVAVYPPALIALEEIRNAKTQQLLQGEGNQETFHDVKAINRCLKEDQQTCRLFEHLEIQRPFLAGVCVRFAMDTILECGEPSLVQKYLSPFKGQIRWQAECLQRDLLPGSDWANNHPEPLRNALVICFVQELDRLLRGMQKIGLAEDAAQFRISALEAITSDHVRKAAEALLEELSPRL